MEKRSRVKDGLAFGAAMAVFYIGWDLLTANNLTSNQILKIAAKGLISATIAGALFGWLISKFKTSRLVESSTKIETEPGETIDYETPANHFKGMEAVGGRLYLTNNRLVFKSHKLNIQNHQLSIHLADIQSVERYKTMGIVNNGLLLTTQQGSKEKFVVEQVEEWVSYLTAKTNRAMA